MASAVRRNGIASPSEYTESSAIPWFTDSCCAATSRMVERIGPILAAILAVASQQDSVNQGVVLLSVYSLGLAIPFLLTALAINQFFAAFKTIRRHYHAIEIVSGLEP